MRLELIEPVDAEPFYDFFDYQRRTPIALLAAAFVGVALLIGRMRGLRALLALAFSLLVIVGLTLPAIVGGSSPLLVALVTSALIMLVALYLTHGPNARTTSALIGTLASLAITGLLGSLFIEAAQLTGLVGEETAYLRATAGFLDFRGLLLAGIIIGSLGVLDDVTVTQASAVWELHGANPNLGLWGLYRAALRIGQDHIASAVNTLVLAYAGASLPLLLLFTQTGEALGTIVTGEVVGTEVVRTLVGSIGLIASVPLTTFLTALVVSGDRLRPARPARVRPHDHDGHEHDHHEHDHHEHDHHEHDHHDHEHDGPEHEHDGGRAAGGFGERRSSPAPMQRRTRREREAHRRGPSNAWDDLSE